MVDKVTKSVGDHTKSDDVFADTRKAIGDAIAAGLGEGA